MTAGTITGLHVVAQELLDASEQIIGGTVGGPPAIVYLAPGLPALDRGCDTLAVWASLINDEQTSPLTPYPQVGQRRRVGWLNIVTLNVEIARCIHVWREGSSMPSVAQLTGDAEKVMEDGWALYNGISTAIIQDGLFGGTCQDIKFPAMVALTPQGAMAGWILTLQVELAGYR